MTFNPLTGYTIDGNTNPTTQVWEASTGTYVANNAAAYLSWLTNGIYDASIHPTGDFGYVMSITGSANNGSGKARLTVPSSAMLQTGQRFQFRNHTGTSGVNGNQQITVVDGTHIDITAVNFVAASADGVLLGPQIILSSGSLPNTVNEVAISSDRPAFRLVNDFSSPVQLTNPLPHVIAIVNTGSGTGNLTLPEMNKNNSLPTGEEFAVIFNSSSTQAVNLKLFGGSTVRTYQANVVAYDRFVNANNSTADGDLQLQNILPITVSQIQDGAVTNAKLADMAEGTVKGRAKGAGTGDPTDLSAAQQAALGSSLVLLQTQTASSSATIDFTTGIDSTYDEYLFVLSNVVPATDAVRLQLEISTDGGSTWKSGATDYVFARNILSSAGTNTPGGATTSVVQLTAVTVSNNSGRPIGGEVRAFAPHLPKLNPINWSVGHYDGTNHYHTTGSGFYNAGTAANGFRFSMNSGNISTGTFSLYGIRK